ncbi:MAG: pirin family protein [Castellaniella sp.]
MTYLLPTTSVDRCTVDERHARELERWPTREADLGAGLTVRRALPVRGHKRLIGPWCFFDHYGPLDFAEGKAMDIAPHPHIGLQTVSWLLAGEAQHDDSLGCEAVVRPGWMNLMTAGNGIAHSEQTPDKHSGTLHGLQLWVALPEAARHGAAYFDQYTDLPTWEPGGGRVQVFMGRLGPVDAATRVFSPIVAADITVAAGGAMQIPLEAGWEHAVYGISGEVTLDGQPLAGPGLSYLGTARAGLELRSRTGARLILIGGAPFGESIVMWWNFVGRSTDEILRARTDWEAGHDRFGEVAAYDGPRLAAPELSGRLAARA